METVTIGNKTLSVEKKFKGIQDWVDEVIVLVRLTGYQVTDRHVSVFNEPQLMVTDHYGHIIFYIEFGTTGGKLCDLDIVVYDEKINFDHNRAYLYSLEQAKEWWSKAITFL